MTLDEVTMEAFRLIGERGRSAAVLLEAFKYAYEAGREAAGEHCLHQGPEGLQCQRSPHAPGIGSHLARRFAGAGAGELDSVVQW